MPMWILFQVPCPTPNGISADELLQKRVDRISPAMQASARKYGCHFHRAWVAADRSAFYAVACWETREGATQFFTEWNIEDEPGEVAIVLEGDIGLVPNP